MNDIKVSVVVPIYNSEKYLRNTIDSVLVQNFKSYEIILVDDGSTDGSASICQDYVIRYSHVHLYSQINSGVTAARLYGVSKAVGHYIFFLDSDDQLMSDCLSVLFQHTDGNDMVMGFLEDAIGIPRSLPNNYTGRGLIHAYLKHDMYGETLTSKLWKRELFSSINAELLTRNIYLAEDFLMNICLLLHVDTVYIVYRQVYHYLNNPDQTTKVRKYTIEYEQMYSERLHTVLEDYPEFNQDIVRFNLFYLKRTTRFRDEDYDPCHPYVVDTCKKALCQLLSFEDYLFILTKNNQNLCRFLLRKTAAYKRLFLHKYH